MGGLVDYKPTMVMLGLQFIYAGVTLFSRAALLQEMSPRVFVVYRQAAATLVMASFAFLTSVTLNQNMYFEGLYLASSSTASAMGNLVPAVTFVLASTVGLEKVNLQSLTSIAKMMGTVLCVSGAVAMALLKGPKLLNTEIIPPTKSLFGSGGVSFFAQAWCIERRGPLFSAMFNPLSTVIVALFASIFLHEEIYIGSLVGTLAVIIGLYVVLWGKAKEHEETNMETATRSQNDQTKAVDVLIDESTNETTCKIDLEEPLLCKKSGEVGEN
ncbi:unnamed protein product [Ilex paraguariensis]|uniref:WAT1-related protein n=1 Tax=Ilex paraguariensis TaxID=185542 RepID=A0ABC8R5Q5_9AQUA